MIRSISVAMACGVALLASTAAAAQDEQSARTGAVDQSTRVLSARPLHTETYAAVPARDAEAQACRVDAAPQTPEPEDSRWQWRLRAYRHLDCVTTLIDAVLADAPPAGRADDENNAVPVAREDLQRIRTLAWWARDAAARIGQ